MTLTCAYCHKKFERPNPIGPIPRYCTAGHRQRAFEERKLNAAVVKEIERAVKKAVAADRRKRR